MGSHHRTSFGLGARACIAFVVAYALVVMSVFAPIARAKAFEDSRHAAMLGVLCLPDGDGNVAEDGKPANPHPHDLGCCMPGKKFVLDAPLIAAKSIAFFEPHIVPRRFAYSVPQSRAPPLQVVTAVNARAPPVPA